MARTAPSCVIATSAPWATPGWSPWGAPAFAPLAGQFPDRRPFGARLQAGIDRGAHHDVFLDMAEHVVERVHDPVGDVIDRAVAGLRYNSRGGRQREVLGWRGGGGGFGP